MPATAEAPNATGATSADIVALLEDKEMALTELASVADAKAIAKAWAAGLIEFGRPTYCTVGPVVDGKPAPEGSTLILEGGMDWSGPKTAHHRPYAGMAAELPACEKYERADVPMVKKTDPRSGQETYHRPAVRREEAERLVGLRVRLTDKGLAAMDL